MKAVARNKPKKKTAKCPKVLKGDALSKQARDIERLLRKDYPDATCELAHENALELAVATILSAQCTDKRVNMVTPALFARFPHARALAAAPQGEVHWPMAVNIRRNWWEVIQKRIWQSYTFQQRNAYHT